MLNPRAHRHRPSSAVLLALLMLGGSLVVTVVAAAASTSAPSGTDAGAASSAWAIASSSAGVATVVQGGTTAVSASVPITGTAPYSWQWLYSTDGGANYALATPAECTVPRGSGAAAGAYESCTFATSGATEPGAYDFELRVTDGATTPESVTSAASSSVLVERATHARSEVDPAAPKFDTDPQEYCTGTCDTANWFGGTGGSGALDITTASADELLILAITDSGETGAQLSTSDVTDSRGSTWSLEASNEWNGMGHYQYVFYALDGTAGADTITVDPAAGTHTGATTATAVLSAFSGVDTSAPIFGKGTFESNTGTQSSASITTSVAPTTILGIVSTTDGASAFTATTSPAFTEAGTINDGVATASFVEYYAASGTGTYTSEPTWTGSVRWGAIAVAIQGASPLSITISPTTEVLDVSQSATFTATATGGTGTLTYTWSVDSGSCPGFTNSGLATLTYSPSGPTTNCVLTVSVEDADGHTAEPTTAAAVTVNSQLSTPATPTISAAALDVNQSETVTGTIPTGGTAPYAWTWLVSVNGGTYATATECATDSGTGATAGATETCAIAANALTSGDTYTFELKVTDSATSPAVVTSAASTTVTVHSALTAPAAPTASTTKLDLNQALTVTGTIPSSGTSPYAWTWLDAVNGGAYGTATVCATDGGTGATAGATETCSIGSGDLVAGDTYAFELKVTDSATTAESETSAASSSVAVASELTAPSAPSVSGTKLDLNQALTVTGTVPTTGTSPYAWTWLVSVDGGAYATATACASDGGTGGAAGATETCAIGAGDLVAGDTYAFELSVTDGASSPESATSAASSTVSVASTLVAPAAPTTSASKLDLNQALTVTGTIPTTGTASYAWTWLVSINGGSYATSTVCATNSGTGAASGAGETCAVAANALTAGDSYTFELEVTDSASSAETVTSAASGAVAVSPPLTAPGAPTVSATKLDLNQALTVTASIPMTGTASFAWTWLDSVSGGTYATASVCATDGGTGAAAGATETCSIGAGDLVAGDTYAFELEVTDSATVAETATSGASSTVSVSSTLTAAGTPSVSATKLDLNQALTITDALPTTGTATYSWQWLVSVSGGSYAAATVCATNSGSGAAAGATETCAVPADGLAAGSTYAFELKVTDSASTAETTTSAASSTITVSSTLAAPSAPTASATKLDLNQALTITGTIPSSGTSTYGWTWLDSVSGGAYGTATVCATDSGTGAAAGATETCAVGSGDLVAGDTYAFELKVTDSASTPETATSSASATVDVSSALATPATPSISATKLDVNQALTVTGTIPSTGTATFTWQWLVSLNGGAYGDSTVCATNSGSGAASGAQESCAVAPDGLAAGTTYAFEIKVTDSATTPESATSAASSVVSVSTELTAPSVPTLSATKLDLDQSLTVTGTIPSTGTAPYAWLWLAALNGGAYGVASECAVDSGTGAAAGATETCSIAGGTLTAGTTLAFELEATDSASTSELATSGATTSVAVSSALVAPDAPSPNATGIDVSQPVGLTVAMPSSGTAPYAWQWLVSVDAGAYADASVCGSGASGTGAAGGAAESCTIPGFTLDAGDNYTFEVEVTDSASSAETVTSAASPTVAVSSALVGGSPSPSNVVLDDGQSVALSAHGAGGSGDYTYQWYTGASPSACEALGSPIAGATGASYTAAPSATTYYCYTIEDSDLDLAVSSSVLLDVNSALTAPTTPAVSATALDANQAASLTSTLPSTGTGPYSWQWLVAVNSGALQSATQCAVASGTGATAGTVETCSIAADSLAAGDNYTFALQVTDSSGAGPETVVSGGAPSIEVRPTLEAPVAPSLSAAILTLAGSLTVTGSLPSTGTAPYNWTWLVSTNGGAYALASLCGSSESGSGGEPGATVTCLVAGGSVTPGATYSFELEVSDRATSSEQATSSASPSVSVALPAISLETGQGPVGATFSIDGTGFSSAAAVTFEFGTTAIVASTCSVGSLSSSGLLTASDGDFDCTFSVPSVSAGSYPLVGTNAATSTATSAISFLVTTPLIAVTPPQGSPGSTVTVNGTGFSVDSTLASLNFDGQPVAACLSGSLQTSGTGAFSCTFRVPNGISGSTVTATDAGGSSATATYRPVSPASSGSPIGTWLWIVVVAAVVAVLLIVVALRRRRSSPAAAASSPPTAPSSAAASPAGDELFGPSPPALAPTVAYVTVLPAVTDSEPAPEPTAPSGIPATHAEVSAEPTEPVPEAPTPAPPAPEESSAVTIPSDSRSDAEGAIELAPVGSASVVEGEAVSAAPMAASGPEPSADLAATSETATVAPLESPLVSPEASSAENPKLPTSATASVPALEPIAGATASSALPLVEPLPESNAPASGPSEEASAIPAESEASPSAGDQLESSEPAPSPDVVDATTAVSAVTPENEPSPLFSAAVLEPTTAEPADVAPAVPPISVPESPVTAPITSEPTLEPSVGPEGTPATLPTEPAADTPPATPESAEPISDIVPPRYELPPPTFVPSSGESPVPATAPLTESPLEPAFPPTVEPSAASSEPAPLTSVGGVSEPLETSAAAPIEPVAAAPETMIVPPRFELASPIPDSSVEPRAEPSASPPDPLLGSDQPAPVADSPAANETSSSPPERTPIPASEPTPEPPIPTPASTVESSGTGGDTVVSSPEDPSLSAERAPPESPSWAPAAEPPLSPPTTIPPAEAKPPSAEEGVATPAYPSEIAESPPGTSAESAASATGPEGADSLAEPTRATSESSSPSNEDYPVPAPLTPAKRAPPDAPSPTPSEEETQAAVNSLLWKLVYPGGEAKETRPKKPEASDSGNDAGSTADGSGA